MFEFVEESNVPTPQKHDNAVIHLWNGRAIWG